MNTLRQWWTTPSFFAAVMTAILASVFIGASCQTPPAPAPSVDASVDVAPPDCRCKPCPAPDATCPSPVDAAPVVDATPPKPAPDAAPKTPCQTACDSLTRAGCKEGSISDCAAKICQINADPRFLHYNVTCLQSATTPAAVQSCGGSCTTQ